MSPNNVSQAVNWLTVHRWVTPLLESARSWPMAGSVAWCQLPDDDPRKLAAVFDAARHWALRVDACQEARAEASKAVAASTDWSKVATELRRLREFRSANPWAKRVSHD
jgi:hypothetical protein